MADTNGKAVRALAMRYAVSVESKEYRKAANISGSLTNSELDWIRKTAKVTKPLLALARINLARETAKRAKRQAIAANAVEKMRPADAKVH